ncbi:MAG: DUF4450 domain-containing protein [Acidobacteriaceae bacterium]
MDSIWNRRQFLFSSAAAATFARTSFAFSHAPQSAIKSPEEISGGIVPLLHSNTARAMRYTPTAEGFLIRNGKEYFNRPLYGPNNPFRVDAGDRPEFSLYLPGHGGNLRLGFANNSDARWLHEAAEITAIYQPGRMIYRVSDPLLDRAVIEVEAFTMGSGAGLQLRIKAHKLSKHAKLLWAFGGVSGRKGRRGGDIGCEVEPVSEFFQVRPNEARNNRYTIQPPTVGRPASVHLQSLAADMLLQFPYGSELAIADAKQWNAGWKALATSSADSPLPVLIGSFAIPQQEAMYITIEREEASGQPEMISGSLADAFNIRRTQIDTVAKTLRIATPDSCINVVGPAISIATDALWDSKLHCVMHGAVAWRMPFAGWRGPYVLDALGDHERFQEHARHWIARQNLAPLPSGENEHPATGAPDPGSHLARTENLLHSRGDLSHNHYDMNLVFFDALLRHLQWTGDLSFAREIWPALTTHLSWERRLFRRTFVGSNGRTLPLYEAYACIWASDNLQYNGGGAAHASAYNYYANQSAAKLARLIGEDPALYDEEAELLLAGMNELLWQPEQGIFAESKDILGPQTAYTSPALWTVYHTIDSLVPTPSQARQMIEERLTALRHVPVHGPGVPPGPWHMLSCSDWMPYQWSLNLLLLAENMHFALALWQAGMADEAFRIFKGSLLDSMFQGLCPGNFHMTSELDVHRQEAQRDFGDPIGITSRALIEGLFGIAPDLLHGAVTIRPGFPAEWDHAELEHRDIDLAWKRQGTREIWEITPHFSRPVILTLVLRVPRTGQPRILVNGVSTQAVFDSEAVGYPVMRVTLPYAPSWKIEVEWSGELVASRQLVHRFKLGESVLANAGIVKVDDPQHALHHGHAVRPGAHTVFLHRHQQHCEWWMPLTFRTEAPEDLVSAKEPVLHHPEPIDLTPLLRSNITEIFDREYIAPRSRFCSLSIPEQGIGGWASFDIHPHIDDRGLRSAGGLLQTPLGVPFRTPKTSSDPNCVFVSLWQQDQPSVELPLSGHANAIWLLMAGSTFPQASRMLHGRISIQYANGAPSILDLRNPETWWPIEQDYLLDDYLFVNEASLPMRVDLYTGKVRTLDRKSFLGKGRAVLGGAATILSLPLDHTRALHSLHFEATLYGPVLGLLAATLSRSYSPSLQGV